MSLKTKFITKGIKNLIFLSYFANKIEEISCYLLKTCGPGVTGILVSPEMMCPRTRFPREFGARAKYPREFCSRDTLFPDFALGNYDSL